MSADINQIREEILSYQEQFASLKNEVYKVLIGQEHLYSRMLIALLCGGHILLEGVPGLAKTTAIKTLSTCFHTKFQRIQFTPDLLPADIIGTQIYNPREASFSVKKGPIFANFILADEINRAPAKVQSALLEAMQEQQVSIGEETFPLEGPFIVMATQNPIEQEGTYPLPEAQIDRFMLKVNIHYPSILEERKIIDRFTEQNLLPVKPVLEPENLLKMRKTLQKIYIDEKVKDYIVSIVEATRNPQDVEYGTGMLRKKGLFFPKGEPIPLKDLIEFGVSPRGSIYLTIAAKASAFLEGRGFVTPQDVKNLALDVLRHRLLLSYEAEANEINSDMIIELLLRELPVP